MEKKDSGFHLGRTRMVLLVAAICILLAVCIFVIIPGFGWIGVLWTLLAAAAVAWKLYKDHKTAQEINEWERAQRAQMEHAQEDGAGTEDQKH